MFNVILSIHYESIFLKPCISCFQRKVLLSTKEFFSENEINTEIIFLTFLFKAKITNLHILITIYSFIAQHYLSLLMPSRTLYRECQYMKIKHASIWNLNYQRVFSSKRHASFQKAVPTSGYLLHCVKLHLRHLKTCVFFCLL